MTRYLPIIILSLVISHLSLVSNVLAQETTTTNTAVTQISPQGNDFENFMKNLIPEQFKQIPNALENINRSYLPLDVGEAIKNSNIQSDESKSSIKPQANSQDSQNDVIKGAFQYEIKSGLHLPADDSKASTNINNVFGGILDFIANIGKIFNQGSDAADKSARQNLPSEVGDQVITKQSAMNDSLPISQCAGLPAGLCGDDNKPNFANK